MIAPMIIAIVLSVVGIALAIWGPGRAQPERFDLTRRRGEPRAHWLARVETAARRRDDFYAERYPNWQRGCKHAHCKLYAKTVGGTRYVWVTCLDCLANVSGGFNQHTYPVEQGWRAPE